MLVVVPVMMVTFMRLVLVTEVTEDVSIANYVLTVEIYFHSSRKFQILISSNISPPPPTVQVYFS